MNTTNSGDAIDAALELAFNCYSLTDESRQDFEDAGLMPASIPLARRLQFADTSSALATTLFDGNISDIVPETDDDETVVAWSNDIDEMFSELLDDNLERDPESTTVSMEEIADEERVMRLWDRTNANGSSCWLRFDDSDE